MPLVLLLYSPLPGILFSWNRFSNIFFVKHYKLIIKNYIITIGSNGRPSNSFC